MWWGFYVEEVMMTDGPAIGRHSGDVFYVVQG